MTKNYLLVGGMPRSGTTIFTEEVSRTLHVEILPETHFLSRVVKSNNFVARARLPAAAKMYAPVVNLYKAYERKYNSKIFNRYELFVKYITELAPEGSQWICEKTPAHIKSFDKLAALDANICFVILVRSLPSVCNSLRRVSWNNAFLFQNVRRWCKYYILALKLRDKFPTSVIIVDYEEFCESPRSVIEKISTKFQIPQRCMQTAHISNGSFDPGYEPWKASALNQVQILKTEFEELTGIELIVLKITEKIFLRIVKIWKD